MRILMRLGVGGIAGIASMGLLLGTLEHEVNPRRMLFIGAIVGLGTAGVLEVLQMGHGSQRAHAPLTPVQALTLQLSRMDLPAGDAVRIAEQLATLQTLQEGEGTGASHSSHSAPRH